MNDMDDRAATLMGDPVVSWDDGQPRDVMASLGKQHAIRARWCPHPDDIVKVTVFRYPHESLPPDETLGEKLVEVPITHDMTAIQERVRQKSLKVLKDLLDVFTATPNLEPLG